MSNIISNMLINVFTNCARWFESIMTATDGAGFWLGAFLVWQVVSKLLKPAIGGIGRGSDEAYNHPPALLPNNDVTDLTL